MLKIVILSAAFLLSENSQACSCFNETLESAFAKYESVFRGKVTKVEKGKSSTSVQLTVDTVWKGKPGKSVKVVTANSGAACGYEFAAKKEYVVFAWRKSPSSPLEVSSCSKTAAADDALETLAWLDQNHSTDEGEEP